MLTVAKLKTRTVKDLASLAKRKGIAGWHAMRKEQLIHALAKLGLGAAPAHASKNGNGAKNGSGRANGCSANGSRAKKLGKSRNGHARPAVKSRSIRIEGRLNQIRSHLLEAKNLAIRSSGGDDGGDRLVVMVRDPYWLHAYWELTRQSVERARAALGQHWHGARPVLRLLELSRDGTTSSARRIVRDIEIHGSVNNWYLDVANPPKTYQIEIGYCSPGARFVCLARSNIVSTPAVGTIKPFGGVWTEGSDDYNRIYALSGGYSAEGDHSDLKELFEERLRRPMGTRFTIAGGGTDLGQRDFNFEVDAELVVFGVTNPDAHVTLKGEPVPLEPDGTFKISFNLPERRQVFPVVASSGDGVEQRTIVLAVERNTKVMEPVIREPEA